MAVPTIHAARARQTQSSSFRFKLKYLIILK